VAKRADEEKHGDLTKRADGKHILTRKLLLTNHN